MGAPHKEVYGGQEDTIVPKAPWSVLASATAIPVGVGGSFAAALQGASRITLNRGAPEEHGISTRDDETGGTVGETKTCPVIMTAVIVIMALIVVLSGLNLYVLNRLIDLSARALLAQMAGG